MINIQNGSFLWSIGVGLALGAGLLLFNASYRRHGATASGKYFGRLTIIIGASFFALGLLASQSDPRGAAILLQLSTMLMAFFLPLECMKERLWPKSETASVAIPSPAPDGAPVQTSPPEPPHLRDLRSAQEKIDEIIRKNRRS